MQRCIIETVSDEFFTSSIVITHLRAGVDVVELKSGYDVIAGGPKRLVREYGPRRTDMDFR